MIERYVEVYRSLLAAPDVRGRPSADRRQAKMASAFDQTWMAPQCGQRTEFPVSTDR